MNSQQYFEFYIPVVTMYDTESLATLYLLLILLPLVDSYRHFKSSKFNNILSALSSNALPRLS